MKIIQSTEYLQLILNILYSPLQTTSIIILCIRANKRQNLQCANATEKPLVCQKLKQSCFPFFVVVYDVYYLCPIRLS